MRTRLTDLRLVLLAVALAGGPAVSDVAAQASAPAKGNTSAATSKSPNGALTFEAMDRNADGRLSEEEFRNASAFVFAGSDRDNDGRVTRDEAVRTGPGAVKTFEAIDTAGTGWLELPAFVDFCVEVFRAADADHDGVVTVAERDAFRAQVRAEVRKANK